MPSRRSEPPTPKAVGERQKAIEAEAERLRELNLEVERVTAERQALQAELGKYTSEVGRLQKEIDQINFEQTRLQRVDGDDRAEPRQGLLPQRAAARLHGADADRPPDCHAERRRRCELRSRREDGPLHDVPSWLSTAEATRSIRSRSGRTPIFRRTSAATRRIRWRRRAAPFAIRDLEARRASTTRRTIRAIRSNDRNGKRSITGTSRTCGTTRCCRRT